MGSKLEFLNFNMQSAGIPGTSLEVSRIAVGTWAMQSPEYVPTIANSAIFVSISRVLGVSPVGYLEAMPMINLSSFLVLRLERENAYFGLRSHPKSGEIGVQFEAGKSFQRNITGLH